MSTADHPQTPSLHEQGEASLRHLLDFITRTAYGCGGARRIAQVLASLYNGDRVRADLWSLSYLDAPLVEHLLHVIRLHCNGGSEIHNYIQGGGAIFEKFIADYGLESRQRDPLSDHDVYRLRQLATAVQGRRFVLREAWYALTGNPRHVFPRRDDTESLRFQLRRYQQEGLIEYSEGPNGGEGWRLTTIGQALIPQPPAQAAA